MKKLQFTELENRVAPSLGLLSFLQELAASESALGEMIGSVVDLQTGEVDVNAAAEAAGGNAVPTVDSYNVSNVVISDSSADAIRNAMSSFFGG